MALTLHGTVSDNTAVLSRPNSKPLIINGDMAVAQRATSVTAVGSTEGYITVDRFNFNANGSPSARFTVALDGTFIFMPRILYTLEGTLGNCSALNLSATCAVFGYAFC